MDTVMLEFRAWHKSRKEMASIYWLDFNERKACLAFNAPYRVEGCIPFDDIVIMQWTGLNDKLGKKIFDGDVIMIDWEDIRYLPHTAVVEWDDRNLCWKFEGGCPTTDSEYFQVVGHCYALPDEPR